MEGAGRERERKNGPFQRRQMQSGSESAQSQKKKTTTTRAGPTMGAASNEERNTRGGVRGAAKALGRTYRFSWVLKDRENQTGRDGQEHCSSRRHTHPRRWQGTGSRLRSPG